MLSKENKAKYLPTRDLQELYEKDENYIRSFIVMDLRELESILLASEFRKKKMSIKEDVVKWAEKMPEFVFYTWSHRFADEVVLRINLENYLAKKLDKKFRIFAKENGYVCETDFFDVKVSKKLKSEVLLVKNGETYDLLYCVVAGYFDMFEKEREACFANGVYGIQVYEEMAPRPIWCLQIERGVSLQNLEKYELETLVR